MRTLLFTLIALLGAAPISAAECCRIVKVDADTPPVVLRVCTPDAAGACGTELFSGTLVLGEQELVCSQTSTIVYQKYDAGTGAFKAPVRAACNGADVQI